MNNGYSDALFSLARENHNIDSMFESFNNFMQLLEDEDIKEYLFSLVVTKEEKKQLIDKLKDNFITDFIYFLYVVLDREDIQNIEDIFLDFKNEYYELAKIKEVIILESSYLEKPRLNKLQQLFDKKYPDYEIRIVEKIDKDMLKGIEVYIDNKKIGANLLSELNELKAKI